MRSRTSRFTRLVPLALSGATALLLVACRSDAPTMTAPSMALAARSSAEKLTVCHINEDGAGSLKSLPASALRGHIGHGDYTVDWEVDKTADFTDESHFLRITDALAAADSTRRAHGEKLSAFCRITITVGPGTYQGAFEASSVLTDERLPLLIRVPDLTVTGGLRMSLDASNRATDQSLSEADVTTLAPNRAMVNTPKLDAMIVVTYAADGYAGNGITINGFAFASGQPAGSTTNGGYGIFSMQVKDLVVSGNRFAPLIHTAIDLRATSATVQRNHARGLGASCGFCFAGPGNYQVRDNTVVNGVRVGMFFVPVIGVAVPAVVTQYTPQASEAITADVTNNSITDHTRHNVGLATGIRILSAGVAGVTQSSTITLSNNSVLRNSFGVMVDGGFGVAGTRGDAVVTLSGNAIAQSCRTDLLLAFSGPNRALNTNSNSNHVENSTYTITRGGNVSDARTWIDHPAGWGNTLIVDGSTVGNTTPLPTLVPTAPCT